MAAPKKIGFAVVGLGSIARSSILPAFAHSRHARLAAVVAREEKDAQTIAKKFGAAAAYGSRDFSVCLKDPDISAVYIATPQNDHAKLTAAAARAGKHVLCEKPLAMNTAQARKMVETCRRRGVLLMTAYRKYFEPSCTYLKKLIDKRALGRLDMIHTAFSERHVPGVSLEWLLEAEVAGGGPLMDLGVYCVNTTRWLAGEDPVRVSAEAWRNDKVRFRSVEEGISFRMVFPSGLRGNGSTSYSAAMSSFIFVQGSQGWACLTPAFPFDEERRLTGKISGKYFEMVFKTVDEFAPEIDAFAKAIQTNGKVEPDGAQGLRDMNIIEAIYSAAKKHKSVTLNY
jgi:predicted dehydrogenase